AARGCANSAFRLPIAMKPNARSKGPRCHNRKADERKAINDLSVAMQLRAPLNIPVTRARMGAQSIRPPRCLLKKSYPAPPGEAMPGMDNSPLFDSFNFLTIRDERQR